MSVIDRNEQRRLLSCVREQAQGGGGDRERVAGLTRRERQRCSQRGRLSVWERVEPVEHRPAELEQSGEGELGFGLDPVGAEYPHPPGVLECVSEQHRLADTRLAPDDERPAAPASRILEQPLDPGAFFVAPEQHEVTLAPPAVAYKRRAIP